ncbi:heavy-metal-associated domain-containing protein [Emticicia sp. TH156]|uniref:heavy-metal-associated domain-containing protein n=1 Tax=Emticicia sp. TH156 TaxID=2067454 RepID=UPI000C757AD1|nr:heavy metal-associated domain-containing protein [Emticicia sp. TH156]PLK42160.1 MerP protein [Emticicia sp. TH156]
MKSTIFSVLAVLFISILSLAFKADPPSQVKIKTSAICEMCKERIEKQLAFTKGVSESNLDLKDKVITITFNPKKTDISKLKKAINDAGYDADETIANEKSYNKLPSCCKKDGEPMHN